MQDQIITISRSELYLAVAENIDKLNEFIIRDEYKDKIKNLYKDSSIFIEQFEKGLDSNDVKNFKWFSTKLKDISLRLHDESFLSFVGTEVYSLVEEEINSKSFSYSKILVLILRKLATFLEEKLEKYFVKIWFNDSNFERIKGNKQQTFLCYAYDDKPLTIGLFLWFLLNDGFLYVNWMWSGTNTYSGITKKELERQLNNSKQFLFLRTLNSELGWYSRQIRQWCSWEIGNYYTKNRNEKFVVNFNTGIIDNDLLHTFRPLRYIKKGRMY